MRAGTIAARIKSERMLKRMALSVLACVVHDTLRIRRWTHRQCSMMSQDALRGGA